jgi:enoyl-CoA hydratase/carnithine racemase
MPSSDLPATLAVETDGAVAHVVIDRAAKRNAIDTATLLGLEAFFARPPAGIRAVVLSGRGDHFCAGLDLSDLTEAGIEEGLRHSRMWHRVTTGIQSSGIPVISVLAGAVIGGGLEIASATHIRVAETSAFYSLPEAQRGLFLGGGGTVRLSRLIGVARMTDLMLTGRVYDAAEGQAAGISQYLVGAGEGVPTALELAARIATTAPMTVFGVLTALPRIADAAPEEGYVLEALMAASASSSPEAQERMTAFLAGRAAKVARPEATS